MLVSQEQMQLAGLDLQKIKEEKLEIDRKNVEIQIQLLELEESKEILSKREIATKKQELIAQQKINLEREVELTQYQTASKYSQDLLERTKQQQKEVEKSLIAEKAASKSIGVRAGMMTKIGKLLGVEQQVRESIVASAKESIEVEEINGKLVAKRKKDTGGIASGFKTVYSSLKENFSVMSTGSKIAMGAGLAMGGIGLAAKGAGMAADAVGAGLSKLGGTMRALSPDSSTFFATMTGPISDMLKNIPILGGLLAGLVDAWAGILDLIIGVDDKIVKMGRQLGMGASQARALNDHFAAIASNSNKAYVTSKRLFDSYAEIAKENGLNNKLSQEILETNIELADYAGLEASTRAELANTAMITGKTMKGVTQAVMGQVAVLKQATGVSFNQQQILKEVTSLGGRLGLEFAKYPAKIANAVVTTKALGLELKQMNQMADSFLDFESSIASEFEAQLITGKDLNLMKVRELVLNNKLAEAAAEIAKQVGSSEEFLKMNRVEAEVWAKGVGMTVDSMGDMLRKQELYTKFQVKNEKELYKQLDIMRQMKGEQAAIAMFKSQEEYSNYMNLSMQEKLMSSFEKIKASIVDFLTNSGILTKLEGFINRMTNPENLRMFIDKIRGGIATLMDFIGSLTASLLKVASLIADLWIFGKKGDQIASMLDRLGSGAKSFTGELSSSLRKPTEAIEPENKQEIKVTKTEKAKDAVIFPSNGLMVNKDPLDYTIFAKNPENLFRPSPAPQMNIGELVAAFAAAIKQQPIKMDYSATLLMDGQVTAKTTVNNIKNSPITGFDKQAGQGSLNNA